MTMATSAIASVMSRLKQARIHRGARRGPPGRRRLAGADWCTISSGWTCVQVAGEVTGGATGELPGGKAGACGAAAGAPRAAGSDAGDGLASTSRRIGSATWGLSMGLSLNSDREQAEDDHVKAELRDRRMAEQLLEAAQTQERSQNEENGERHRRVADEGRNENAAEDELGKRVHHDAFSVAGAAASAAASMAVAATTRASLISSVNVHSAPARSFKARLRSRRRRVS